MTTKQPIKSAIVPETSDSRILDKARCVPMTTKPTASTWPERVYAADLNESKNFDCWDCTDFYFDERMENAIEYIRTDLAPPDALLDEVLDALRNGEENADILQKKYSYLDVIDFNGDKIRAAIAALEKYRGKK